MDACTQARPGLTGTALKRIACLSMLADHIGASCLECGPLTSFPLFFSGSAWQAALAVATPEMQALFWLDTVLRLIGRLAFPIYCFLLVEGFLHTHNAGTYALRLLAFAFLSEVPFDLAFFQDAFYPAYQNVFFTLFFGLCCLLLLRQLEAHTLPAAILLRLLVIGLCGGLAEALQTDYGFFGVVLIAVLYLLREKPARRIFAGCMLTCWEITAPLAFLPIGAYNGRRGKCPRWEQYGFYAFYPVHLSILAALTLVFCHAA